MKITLPQKFAKHLTSPNYVNDCLNYYWDTHGMALLPAMESRLLGLKAEWLNALKYPETFKLFYGDGDIINTTSKFRSFTRLALGYNIPFGTFIPKNIRFELFSENAYDLKINGKMGKKITKDHIFGTTEVGIQMFDAYKDSDWDTDYMLNEYIPQTLYQYSLCRLLKSEHQKEDKDDTNGVARGKHTLNEKISLLHYKESNITLPLKVHKLGIL
tara:strand:- start:2607 stop:3251 length:645 start_codon:yes stop_codon:yes gene_type:complete